MGLKLLVLQLCVSSAPLEAVGGVGGGHPGRGHLQTPPLRGRTGEVTPRLTSLEERRAQPGPSLRPRGEARPELAHPSGSQLQPLLLLGLVLVLVLVVLGEENKVTAAAHFPLCGRGGVAVVVTGLDTGIYRGVEDWQSHHHHRGGKRR